MSIARESSPPVLIRTWIGFAMMCLGMFMAILDVQVVASSLPTIQKAMGVTPDKMSWVQTAYLISEVIAIPLTGLLTRILSMRWLFVIGLSIFTAASVGCADSGTFTALIAWRVIQGCSGGVLIPAVFSAVFLLFPLQFQGIATTVAGALAVLAPTIGPVVGGWTTESYSWHWLFLINVAPGAVAALGAAKFLPRERTDFRATRQIDGWAMLLLASSLASLVLGLKEAPKSGWSSPPVLGLLSFSIFTAILFAIRSLRSASPVVNIRNLRNPIFAVGCLLSFTLGVGLFGSVYMMPVFLSRVHDYGALKIGTIMLVTGAAQLITAPIAVALEKRTDPRILSCLGFLLFATGLWMSSTETLQTDYEEMFWPQVVRGVAIMFCLLPPTRMALGYLPAKDVPDGSGLFNLMRNIGGAIGLALIDTVIYGRAAGHGEAIIAELQAHNAETAQSLGISASMFASIAPGPLDPSLQTMAAPMVEKLAFVRAMNDAWTMAAALTALSILGILAVLHHRSPSR